MTNPNTSHTFFSMTWSIKFDGGILVKEIDNDELNRICDAHYDRIFANRVIDIPVTKIEDSVKEKIDQRSKDFKPYRLRLGIYQGNETIGWHWGYAIDPETYYMQNSAIMENYQKQGYYTLLLSGCLQKIKEEGFQVVTSTHHANNPAVLIPKLKIGFIITGVQFNEKFRFILEMKYFFDKERMKSLGQRMGLDLG